MQYAMFKNIEKNAIWLHPKTPNEHDENIQIRYIGTLCDVSNAFCLTSKTFFLYVSDKTLFLLQTDCFLIYSFHYFTPHDRYKGDCIFYLSKV